MRHELKTVINYQDYLVLRSRLRALFSHDAHADAHGEYRVRSLYFDDLFDSALLEKINGVRQREKFRLRYYNNNTSLIRLEKKAKLNSLSEKTSAPLTAEQTQRILHGDTAWLRDSGNHLLLEFYSKYRGNGFRPKTIVEYTREAFSFSPGNVRITLDRGIKTGVYSLDFFGEEIPLLDAGEAFGVMELKFDRILPEIVQKAVMVPNRRIAAFSKYAVGRRYD